MPKVQNAMTRDFTVVHNAFLKDKKLGITERGLLITMLEKPDNYNFTIRGLAYELTDGVTKISNALKKLEELGYLKRIRIIENGKFADMLYQFSDEAIFLSDVSNESTVKSSMHIPNAENQHTDSEHTEKPYDLINTDKTNTDKLNTDKLNTEEINTPPVANKTANVVSQKTQPKKKSYAESVKMTEEEYRKLTETHTTAFVDKCIEVLNNYKLSSGKRYKSDYHTILNWVVERVAKDCPQLDKTAVQESTAYDVNVNPFDQFV